MTNYTHWFIRARLKTRQLLLLVALAEEGNIHRAAQVLNMTQPAASKLLSRGLSPSALDDLAACPFMFFAKRLLRLPEAEAAGGQPEAVGRVVEFGEGEADFAVTGVLAYPRILPAARQPGHDHDLAARVVVGMVGWSALRPVKADEATVVGGERIRPVHAAVLLTEVAEEVDPPA